MKRLLATAFAIVLFFCARSDAQVQGDLSGNLITGGPLTIANLSVANQLLYTTSAFNVGSGTTLPFSFKMNLNAAALQAGPTGTTFQVGQADGVSSRIVLDAFAATPSYICRRADTSGANPSAVQSGEQLCGLSAFGFGQTVYSGIRASENITAAEAWSDTAQGTYIGWTTTAAGGTSTTEKMRLTSGLQLGTPTGGDCGTGCLNLTDVRINNVSLSAASSPVTAQAQPGNPTGTTSTVGVMMGLAGSITPITSGKVLIIISGDSTDSVISDGTAIQIRYGTGSAPTNGAALTGTAAGALVRTNDAAAAGLTPFSVNAIISLTPATAYWIDLSLAAITGGTATIADVSISAVEL